jgi:urease accessory protein
MTGWNVPFVEFGIGLSVIVLGAAVATNLSVSVAAAMALVGFFAIFHGHAHGAEMPTAASGLMYAAGFTLATIILHISGIGLGLVIGRIATHTSRQIARIGCSAMAVAGAGILVGLL